MKISPTTSIHKNTSTYNKNVYYNKNLNVLSFRSAKYPSGTYSDDEISLAKEYSGKQNWQDEYRKKRIDVLMKDFNDKFDECLDYDNHILKSYFYWYLWLITVPSTFAVEFVKNNNANKKIDAEIRRISALMIDLNNQQLKIAQQKQSELKKREKILERENAIRDKLNTNIIQPLEFSKNNSDAKASTAVLVYGGTKSEREDAINWIKSKLDLRTVTVNLPQDEGDALYRIETEIDYAKKYYSTNKNRTVLFVENFDYILNSENISPMAIADMKELMSSLSKDKEPITIVFQTDDKSKIDDAFIGNEIRIPCKIDLDEIK